MRYSTIILLLMVGISNAIAQSFLPDTTIYLTIDKSSHYLKFAQRKVSPAGKSYPVFRYILYQPYVQPPPPLTFVSEYTALVDTITVEEMKSYPTYTLDSLSSLLYSKDYDMSSYFDDLHSVYLLETDKKILDSKVTITKIYPSCACKDNLYSIYHPEAFYKPLSPENDSLYLLFEEDKFYKSDSAREINHETMEWYPINRYAITESGYQLYDGYPLRFISEHTALIDTTAIDNTENLPIVTPEQLRTFIGDYYGEWNGRYYGANYFRCLKHIYLVEKDSTNQTATITEVFLNIGRE